MEQPSYPTERFCEFSLCQTLLADTEEELVEAREKIAVLQARIDQIDKTETLVVNGGGDRDRETGIERRFEEIETVL